MMRTWYDRKKLCKDKSYLERQLLFGTDLISQRHHLITNQYTFHYKAPYKAPLQNMSW